MSAFRWTAALIVREALNNVSLFEDNLLDIIGETFYFLS